MKDRMIKRLDALETGLRVSVGPDLVQRALHATADEAEALRLELDKHPASKKHDGQMVDIARALLNSQ
jgi:hypothetical protein